MPPRFLDRPVGGGAAEGRVTRGGGALTAASLAGLSIAEQFARVVGGCWGGQ